MRSIHCWTARPPNKKGSPTRVPFFLPSSRPSGSKTILVVSFFPILWLSIDRLLCFVLPGNTSLTVNQLFSQHKHLFNSLTLSVSLSLCPSLYISLYWQSQWQNTAQIYSTKGNSPSQLQGRAPYVSRATHTSRTIHTSRFRDLWDRAGVRGSGEMAGIPPPSPRGVRFYARPANSERMAASAAPAVGDSQ